MEFSRILDENMSLQGNTIEDFLNATNYVDSNTGVDEIELTDSSLYIYRGETESGDLAFWELPPSLSVPNIITDRQFLQTKTIKASAFDTAVTKDTIIELAKNNLMIVSNINTEAPSRTYFMSEKAIVSLNKMTGCDCPSMLNGVSLVRACAIRDAVDRAGVTVSIVYRQEHGIRKIYYVGSKSYARIPDSLLVSLIEKCQNETKEKLNFNHFSITQDFTDVVLSFDDIGERIKRTYGIDNLVPGITISNSATGQSSLIIRSIWLKNGKYIIEDEFKRRHSGDLDMTDLITKSMHSIFKDFFKLPKQLIQLALVDITDPSAEPKENEDIFVDTIKNINKKLELVKRVGKKNEMLISNYILASYNPNLYYTAYDIVDLYMGLPSIITGLSRQKTHALQKACCEVPYLDIATINEEEKIEFTM